MSARPSICDLKPASRRAEGNLAFEFDAADRWTVAYDKASNRVTRNLDVTGRVRALTDPLNQTARTHYDAANRPVREVGPLTNGAYPVTCNQYDALGHLGEIWAGSTSDPDANTCDLTGADPNLKKQASYVVNDFGWRVRETDPLGQIQSYTRDRHGNVLTATDARGQKIEQTWGHGHQLLSRTIKHADGSVYRTVSYTRNALGQPESIGQTNPSLTTTYRHDAAHRVTSVTDSRGNKTLTHDWSPGGLLNHTEDSDGNRTDYLYDAVGRLTGVWAPNYDYVAYAHDPGGRLVEKSVRISGAPSMVVVAISLVVMDGGSTTGGQQFWNEWTG